MKFQLIFAVVMTTSFLAEAATRFSDSASAIAKQQIVHRLQIKKVSDLNFGEASPGDGPKLIPAGTAENAENASFEVRGEPSRMYQIVLPGNNSVVMTTSGGGPNGEITIKEFNSFPARAGVMDPNGGSTIYVGALREAISTKQKVGEYTGQFVITVVY
ncbi:hypothetical protein D3C87_1728470 [compost metagenome]